MIVYDYKVVPAPTKGQKARGVKTPEARFANTVEQALNSLALEGWEFLRAETLPSEERQGLTHTATTFRSILVFRRPQQPAEAASLPLLALEAPIDPVSPVTPVPTVPPGTPAITKPALVAEAPPRKPRDPAARIFGRTAKPNDDTTLDVEDFEDDGDAMGNILRDRVAQLMDKAKN